MARRNLDGGEDPPQRNFLGTRVHAVTMAAALSACEAAIDAHTTLSIGVVNAAKIVKMRFDPVLRESVEQSDLVVADGMSVVWASRVLGQALPERVTGIDLFEGLTALAERRGFSIYLLGATREVLDGVQRVVRERHPQLRIAGARDGYFADGEADAVARDVADSGADLLFVAISTPKKELFLARHGDQLGVCVRHGVGGSFDVLAGKVQRAPEAWQRAGFEWLYRVLQEPGRMWRRYLVTNTIFLAMVAREWLRTRPWPGVRA